ncbi:MAG: tetratricopeptide repeat protein [Pseudomonadota bacterium]
MRLVLGLAVGAAALATVWPADADAQDRRTRARLEALEEQIQDLQGVVYGADNKVGASVSYQGANPNPQTVSSGSSAADTAVRIGALESEVQRLTGEIEELSFRLNQHQEQMRRFIELEFPGYASALEGGGSSGGDNYSPADAMIGVPVDLVGGGSGGPGEGGFDNPDSAFRAGRAALLEARYAEAELAFVSLIEDYPNDVLASDASFYLGETYLAQGDLGAAGRTFRDFIQAYPSDDRVPEAYFKLGQALARADQVSKACQVWNIALRNYRQMPNDTRRLITDSRDSSCS